jgi:hypothetical protein
MERLILGGNVASADSNAKTETYANVAEKKLAFLGRFNYGMMYAYGK